jgi:hypothetical protein
VIQDYYNILCCQPLSFQLSGNSWLEDVKCTNLLPVIHKLFYPQLCYSTRMSSQNNGGGRASGTMGESTRQRLAGMIQAAKSDGHAGAGAGDRPHTPGAAYVGGFQGGLGGTWSKTPTGRSTPASMQAKNPILGGQAPRCNAHSFSPSCHLQARS